MISLGNGWIVALASLCLFPLTLQAEHIIVKKYDDKSDTYVKSVKFKGLENINSETWTKVEQGNYPGKVTCMVDGALVSTEIDFKAVGDESVYYMIIADSGCGYMRLTKQKDSVSTSQR
jgi:hypothetical protein